MLYVVQGDALAKDPVRPSLIDEDDGNQAACGDRHDRQRVRRGGGVIDRQVIRGIHAGDHQVGEKRRKDADGSQDDGRRAESEGGNRAAAGEGATPWKAKTKRKARPPTMV